MFKIVFFHVKNPPVFTIFLLGNVTPPPGEGALFEEIYMVFIQIWSCHELGIRTQNGGSITNHPHICIFVFQFR